MKVWDQVVDGILRVGNKSDKFNTYIAQKLDFPIIVKKSDLPRLEYALVQLNTTLVKKPKVDPALNMLECKTQLFPFNVIRKISLYPEELLITDHCNFIVCLLLFKLFSLIKSC